ncbi:MAG: YhbY family RNA-binding protein [Candidatus Hodarchaeales archaeon]|jgi:RNA-binding protein YhbY
MSKMNKTKLLQIRSDPASLQVGKNGVSEEFIQELTSRMNSEDYIKIKFLKNAPFDSRKEAFADLKVKCKGQFSLLESRGWTVILKKTR